MHAQYYRAECVTFSCCALYSRYTTKERYYDVANHRKKYCSVLYLQPLRLIKLLLRVCEAAAAGDLLLNKLVRELHGTRDGDKMTTKVSKDELVDVGTRGINTRRRMADREESARVS